MDGDKLFQKQPAEQPRKHAHRQEEAWPTGCPALTVQGNAAARNDHMDMGWWVSADPHVCSTDVTPIRAPKCLGSAAIVIIVSAEALEQKVVNHGLVLKGDVADRRRQGEDHMVI